MQDQVTPMTAGVDEVGRGPLAGAVVAAAVILDPNQPIAGLADSKKLSEAKRELLFDQIVMHCHCYAIGRAEAHEIDEINIHQASLLAMQRAIQQLAVKPDNLLIDGKFCPETGIPSEAIIKGDSKVAAISAASIIAKVTRDREMVALADQYPGYGFAEHKGYPTKQHLQALRTNGITPIHRRSYAPVKKLIAQPSQVSV